jgi:6-phosphogluconolactonase
MKFRERIKLMESDRTVYVGAYTRKEPFIDGKAKGIAIFQFDPNTGVLFRVDEVPAGENPSFIAISPDKKNLYAVNEISRKLGPNGWISAFAIDPSDRRLTYLSRQSTQGFSPCHLCITDDGRFVIAANYESGSVCLLPRNQDGSLDQACDIMQFYGNGPDPRQAGPHAHMVISTPDGNWILVVDLGSDAIWILTIDVTHGKFQEASPSYFKLPLGSGPRHIDFHPNGRFAYVLGELDSSVTLYHYQPENGSFLQKDTVSTLPNNFRGQNSGAEIQVAPAGDFVYVSNRGHDSLGIFNVDAVDGRLRLIGHQSTHGKTPRHFSIDPSGNYLIAANQDSDSLVVFKVDLDSGLLTLKGAPRKTPSPVCIKFL